MKYTIHLPENPALRVFVDELSFVHLESAVRILMQKGMPQLLTHSFYPIIPLIPKPGSEVKYPAVIQFCLEPKIQTRSTKKLWFKMEVNQVFELSDHAKSGDSSDNMSPRIIPRQDITDDTLKEMLKTEKHHDHEIEYNPIDGIPYWKKNQSFMS